MPFVHPWIFAAGAGAASIPIIIHLLNRRRFRIRDWAAMQFLLDSIRKNRRRLRIEELILLAIRTLLVVLVGMTIARLTGCGSMSVLPGGQGTRSTVFVLDDSYSTGQKRGAASLFDAQRADLISQIEAMPRTDRVAIVLTSQLADDQPLLSMQDNVDPEGLVERLGSLKPSDRRTDLAAALERAGSMLEGVESGTKQVMVFSDFRTVDLAGQERTRSIGERFKALRADGVEVVALDYGQSSSDNLTLEGIEQLTRFAVASQPIRMLVSVRNNGQADAEDVEVRFRVRLGGRDEALSLPIQRIDRIAPGEVRRVEATYNPSQAGAAMVSAELPADELSADNAAHLSIDVREALQVLIVDGRPNLEADKSESYFLDTAIDPYDRGTHGMVSEVIPFESLPSVRFSEYDLVMLADVPEFPLQMGEEGQTVHAQLPQLEAFVRGGGGLVVWTGDSVNLAFYGTDGAFWDRGNGLLPFPLGPRVDAGEDRFFRIDPQTCLPDGLLGWFTGEGAIITRLIRFRSFTPVVQVPSMASSADIKPPRVEARFDDENGSPLVVTRRYGRGWSVLITTTASKRWTDWPIAGDREFSPYVLVVREMVRRYARSDRRTLGGLVGEPIVHRLDSEYTDATATLETPRYPAADLVTLVSRPEENTSTGRVENRLRFQRTGESGLYTLRLEPPGGDVKSYFYVRNVEGAEGDLRPGGQDELNVVFGAGEYRYVKRTGASEATIAGSEPENEYWMWLLAGAVALLATETVLARRFGHYNS